MKKSYISPLVSEIEMSVELGFCKSPAGANLALGDRFYDDVVSEENQW